jgi:APA family basic amino acid/polyamine antiporter
MGSMVGTGVFVSVGIATDVAGAGVLAAVLIAGALAAANGISSAQLAAAHPVSGGTYEYGHLRLSPGWGFSAGLTFMLAKSASAATAALGFAGYLLEFGGVSSGVVRGAVAAGTALALTAFVAGGIRRSNLGNAVVVGITLTGLLTLVAAALPTILERGGAPFTPFMGRPGGGLPEAASGPAGEGGGEGGVVAVLHGSALMFVAFTGYGRIATLGEEVRDPARVIPRAIGVTVSAVVLLYLAVAATGVGVLGADDFGRAAVAGAAPLQEVARAVGPGWLAGVVALAATTAMAGVLLNLVLGLSRVLLAMARRGDAPAALARIDARHSSPVLSVWACGLFIAILTLPGDVRTTWSFSAFTVLVYYAITNLAALRLPAEHRRFPRLIPVAGLCGCLGLAFWVEPRFWISGLALLGAGHAIRAALGRRAGPPPGIARGPERG